MKKLWIIVLLGLLISSVGYARDAYTPGKTWETIFKIGSEARITSAKKLTKTQIRIVRQTFNNTKTRFFKYYSVSEEMCRLDPVNIIIVKNYHELDDRRKFPQESVYSDKPGEGNKIVFGRYFTITNNLYIVPVNLEKYYWRRNLAHELTHYFFDECDVEFNDIDEEHEYMYDFLRSNRDVFY